jgi:hypothetical protein
MFARMERANSTLEVTRSELRVGATTHQVPQRAGRSASDSDLLDAYLDFVQTMRKSSGAVWLRNEDLDVLSQVLGWTTDAVRADLEGRMVAIREDAKRKKQTRTKQRRLVFAAFGVAVVGSGLVLTSQVRAATSKPVPNVGNARVVERDGGVIKDLFGAGDASVESDASTVQLGDSQTISAE